MKHLTPMAGAVSRNSTPSPTTPHTFSSLLRSFDIRHPSDLAVFLGTPSPTAHPAAAASPPGQFDAADFLHGHLSEILSGGATLQIDLEDPGGINLGDYYMGPGLEQLIEQLAENDPNRYGTLPAAKSAIAALPDVAVSADTIADDGGTQCAVCMEDFRHGIKAKQLACKHIFHKDCILPWLYLHSSCPVCRFELPTDEIDDQYHQEAEQSSDSAIPTALTPHTGSPPGTPRVRERRFRISLPSPLRTEFDCQVDAAAGAGSGRRCSLEDLD